MRFPRVPLKHLALAISRGSAPSYSDDTTGDAWVVGQSCQRPDGSFDPSRARLHAGPVPIKGRLHGTEVLINSTGTGTLGRVTALRGLPEGLPWFADSHVTVVRVDPRRADSRFIGYTLGLGSFGRYAEHALSVGATKQRELNVELVRRHRIAAPPVAGQAAIADFLDRECSRIDDMISSTTGLATSLLAAHWERHHDLLLVADQTIRLKYLTGVPQTGSWGGDPLSDVVERRCFRVTDFDRRHLCLGGPGAARSYPQAQAQRLALRANDLILEKSGGGENNPVGFVVRCTTASTGHLCSNFVARIRPLNADSTWLTFVFAALYAARRNAPFVKQVTGIQNLDTDAYLSLRVPDLRLDDQREIAAQVNDSLERTLRLIDESTHLATGSAEYRAALITEAVSGRIDVTRMSEAQMDERLHEVRDTAGSAVVA